jgi:hypothetical protein
MAIWYIDPRISAGDESDSFDGGKGSGKLRDAIADLTWVAGDQYYIARGSTVGRIAPNQSGTATARITLSAYGAGALPIVQGGADEDALDLGRSGTRNFYDISYLDLRGGTGTSRSGLYALGGVVTTVRNETVRHCRITAQAGAAMNIRGDGWVIEHNTLYDSKIDGLIGDFRNATIAHNTIYGNDRELINGDGIQLFGTHDCGAVKIIDNDVSHPANSPKQAILVTAASGSAIVRGNRVRGGVSAIALEVPGAVCVGNDIADATNGVSILAAGCVVTGNDITRFSGGVIFTDTDGTGAKIYNNTFSDITLRGVYNTVGTVSWTAWNNIFVRCAQALYVQNSITFASNYNCYHDCAVPFRINGTDYATMAAYATGASQEANGVEADPLLGSGNSIPATSPCKGAGVYIPGAKHFGGHSMSVVSPDIGARRYFSPRATVNRG